MKTLAGILALSMLAVAPTASFAQSRRTNEYATCNDTMSGMDQRCVGITESGALSDFTTGHQERVIDRAASQMHPAAR